MISPIDIYYSLTDLGAVAQITALTGATKRTVNILTVNLSPDDEFEKINYLSGTVYWNTETQTMNVDLTPINYPKSVVSFSQFYFSDVLKNKGFIYIDLKDYKILPDGLLPGYAVGVNWTGRSTDHDADNGVKNIKLIFEVRSES